MVLVVTQRVDKKIYKNKVHNGSRVYKKHKDLSMSCSKSRKIHQMTRNGLIKYDGLRHKLKNGNINMKPKQQNMVVKIIEIMSPKFKNGRIV